MVTFVYLDADVLLTPADCHDICYSLFTLHYYTSFCSLGNQLFSCVSMMCLFAPHCQSVSSRKKITWSYFYIQQGKSSIRFG